MALNELNKLSFSQHKFSVYEGGMMKWKKEGKETISKGSGFPLMRQLQIVASTLIILAFLGANFISASFLEAQMLLLRHQSK